MLCQQSWSAADSYRVRSQPLSKQTFIQTKGILHCENLQVGCLISMFWRKFAEIRLIRKCAQLKQLALKQSPAFWRDATYETKSLKVFITRFIPCDSNSLSFLCSCDRICTHVRIKRQQLRARNTLLNIKYCLQNRQRSRKYEKSSRVRHTHQQSSLSFPYADFRDVERARQFFFFLFGRARWFVFNILVSPDA